MAKGSGTSGRANPGSVHDLSQITRSPDARLRGVANTSTTGVTDPVRRAESEGKGRDKAKGKAPKRKVRRVIRLSQLHPLIKHHGAKFFLLVMVF